MPEVNTVPGKSVLATAQTNKHSDVFQKLATTLLIVLFGFFLWVKADMNPENNYLSSFGVVENTGSKYTNLKAQEQTLLNQKMEIMSQESQLKHKLEIKEYTLYAQQIQDLRKQNKRWFDEKDSEGNFQMGIIDSVNHMKDYFNDRLYSDPQKIIIGNSNIKISNISVDQGSMSFSVEGTNLFGNVFYLSSEFIEMLNSFPFFKDGEIKNFTRQTNKSGEDTMNFSVKLDMQSPDEKDPADTRFGEFDQWAQKNIDSYKK